MPPEAVPQEDELDLRHYFHVLSRHRWIVAAATVCIAALALGLSLIQKPVYQGDARVLLEADPAETVFNPNTGQRNDPERAVDTEIEVVKSKPVEQLVEKQLGPVPRVIASAVGKTDVISVRAKDHNPKRAAAIANSYASNYVEYKQDRAVQSLLDAAKEINQQVATLQAQVDGLDAQIQQAPAASNDLKVQRDGLIQQIGSFRQQLDQVQVQSRLKEGGAQLVTSAEVPGVPVAPRPARSTALGLVLGLLLGVGVAFLREQFDDTIRTKDDVEYVSKLPVLAIIPSSSRTQPASVVSLEDPSSTVAEAYRGLRTAVQFANLANDAKILEVTSPSASEGKTTTAANLAMAMAAAGSKVILVCCDLRRPRIHELFGLSNKVGFTSVLLGDVQLDEALQQVRQVPNAWVLASGQPPPNPSELLSISRTGELFKLLTNIADLVIVDSPPVLPVTDALVLSRWADAVAIVVSANDTSRHAFGRSLELLGQVDAPVIGAVLNGVTHGSGSYGYGYGYQYNYYGHSEANGANGKHRRLADRRTRR